MKEAVVKSPSIRNYFVDEAGDGTLFDRKGRVIVGTEGCSRFFMRYLALLWPAFSLVRDLDDTRRARYGVYYTQKKPLSLAALRDLPGI